jgi:toxin ParE1/3/4
LSARRFLIRPKADLDLDDQACYLAQESGPEAGHRFLDSAHQTFALLATQPHMGWKSSLTAPRYGDLRVFRVRGFDRVLIIYRPHPDGIEVLRVLHGARGLRRVLRLEGVE